MILPLPRTGPSRRCRLQLMTKIRLSSFSRAGHADGAERFDFVGLAVAEEGPHLAITGLGQSARIEVLHEAGLVDGLDRAEAHRHGRELPEVRHQPRMRVGRDALAVGFLAEVVHLFLGQATEHEGARIDARHRVALEEDQVAAGRIVDAAPEMREADVVQRGSRSEGSDVAADVGVLVGAHDHGHGVPADIGVNLDLHVRIARVLGLFVGRDGVDVFGIGRVRDVDAVLAGLADQRLDQVVGALGAFIRDDAFKGVESIPWFPADLCRRAGRSAGRPWFVSYGGFSFCLAGLAGQL
jgi:hypothetical protein